MIKRIELHKKQIEYTLKVSKRARRMRLAVYCDGSFVVTAPITMNSSLIEQFIIRKAQWVLDKLEYFNGFSGRLFTRSTSKDFAEHKDAALALAKERIKHFNKTYRFKFNEINIKDQKTRWGSCSKKGNLNFNFKIAVLPKRLADYIIVHELCHLGEFNHSRKFWNLVAKAIPDYLEIRNELKHNNVSFF